jgi:hypothetical protein
MPSRTLQRCIQRNAQLLLAERLEQTLHRTQL